MQLGKWIIGRLGRFQSPSVGNTADITGWDRRRETANIFTQGIGLEASVFVAPSPAFPGRMLNSDSMNRPLPLLPKGD